MKGSRWLCLMLLLPLAAQAGRLDEARKLVEASMHLTGTLTAGPDGKVSEYAIDGQDKVDGQVLAFVKRNVENWRFEPTTLAGQPVSIKNKMSLNLVAVPRTADAYEMRLGAVFFYPFVESGSNKATARRFGRMQAPHYPVEAAMAGAQGTVYLVLKMNADGSVQNVFAEQTNLRFISNERTMELTRKLFADAAIRAARGWKLSAEWLDPNDLQVRVPVDYCISDCNSSYGQWRPYMPGPSRRAPWQAPEMAAGFSPDALPTSGGVFPAGESTGLKLLTPLQGGS